MSSNFVPDYDFLNSLDPSDPAHWSIWEHAVRRAEDTPDAHFAVAPSLELTFSQLVRDSEVLAARLHALGVQAGDSVSYQLPNSYEALIVFLAAMRLGAIANPLMTTYRARELRHILKEMRSKILFIPSVYRRQDYRDLVRQVDLPDSVHVVVCGESGGFTPFDKLMSGDNAGAAPDYLRRPDDVAVVVYTSGTSGMPKGVQHSQRTLIYDSYTAAINALAGAADVSLVPSSFAHIGGLCHAHIVPLLLGSTMCFLDTWSVDAAVALIRERRITWTTGPTPFLADLLAHPAGGAGAIASLRTFRCGGADVPSSLILRAQKAGIDAVRCYGCSEMPTISGVSGGAPERAAYTDGQIHAHVRLRIVDARDGRVLSFGQVGEIEVQGPELFLGYRDEEATSAAMTDDGWLRTGDLGSVDADGFVTVAGRKKDIIIRKGENISAREIEELLAEHPEIEDVAVIGLPDAERGEMVTAVIVTRDRGQLSIEDLRLFLDGIGVARQKYPERVECIDVLPRTGTGKIQKESLRTLFL